MNNNDIYCQYMYSYLYKMVYWELENVGFSEVKLWIYEYGIYLYVYMLFC